ncbi:ABC transporter substrate-binding protein [Oscillospiraceae bacterium PP1C4]
MTKSTKLTKYIALALCTIMVGGVACGCSGSSPSPSVDPSSSSASSGEAAKEAANATYKKEIIIGLANTFTTADPQATASITNQILYTVTHSTLLKWDYETSKYVCDLAESYEKVDDKTYIFKLHPDAFFHSGEPVKASDIIYTYTRGKESAYTSAKVAIIDTMTAVDDHTIQFNLTGPSQNFLFDLTNPNMSILSEKAMTADGEQGAMIGSGAYYYESIDFGNETKLYRFDKYFGEMPKSEQLTFRQYSEDATRVIALQTGDIDYCQTPSTMDLEYIAQDKNLDLIQMEGTRLNYMVMNNSKKPFTDKKVRQALNYAINKDDVVKVAANGFGTVYKCYLTPISYAFYGDMEGYNYNIEKAKALLAEAGYPNGFEFSVLCHDSTSRGIAPVLQAQFAQIGVTMNIQEVETAVRNSMIKANEHDACMAAHVNLVSADNNLRLLFYTNFANNRMKYSNPKVDQLLDSAMIETDEAKRLSMYKELQEIVVDDAICIPLYVETLNIAKKHSLEGVKINATGCHNFTYSYIVEA